MAAQSNVHNHKQREQQKEQLILPSTPISKKHNDLRQLQHNSSKINNSINRKTNVIPPTLAPLVPLHYKYFTPQCKTKNGQLIAHYPYHNNQAIPRKTNIIPKEKQSQNVGKHHTLHPTEDVVDGKDDDDDINNNDETTPLNRSDLVLNENYINNNHLPVNNENGSIQTLLRQNDLSNDNYRINPMLKQHHINYKIQKENIRNSNENFQLTKHNRYSNIYEYSLTAIHEDISSDDS